MNLVVSSFVFFLKIDNFSVYVWIFWFFASQTFYDKTCLHLVKIHNYSVQINLKHGLILIFEQLKNRNNYPHKTMEGGHTKSKIDLIRKLTLFYPDSLVYRLSVCVLNRVRDRGYPLLGSPILGLNGRPVLPGFH